MPKSDLRLIKNSKEFLDQGDLISIPRGARGIYVLYFRRGRDRAESHHYDVVYVGLATRNIRSRIRSHSRFKKDQWTHFSFFEVWDNISDEEIAELEGMFRHIYRFDSKANSLNQQKAYKKLNLVRRRSKDKWL